MRASTKHLTVGTGKPLLSLGGFARTAAWQVSERAVTMFLSPLPWRTRVWESSAILCVSRSQPSASHPRHRLPGDSTHGRGQILAAARCTPGRAVAPMLRDFWDDGIDGPER